MQREVIPHKLLTRRAAILGAGQAILFAALAERMYQLQVLDADRYAVLADENRINLQLLAPQRGRILDRFGTALADNHQNYRLVVVAEQAGDITATLEALAGLIEIGEGGPSPGIARHQAQASIRAGSGPRQFELGRDGAHRGRHP